VAPKVSSIFQRKFRYNFTLKIESFRNFATIFQTLSKNFNFKYFDKNENIAEHNICNFSTNLLGGMEIVLEGCEILPKVSPKVSTYGGISKYYKNQGKNKIL